LHRALVELLGEDFRFNKVADLGAGTGLCGVALRAHAGELVAIDISANMLRGAQSKAVYDSIIIGDIVDKLNERDDVFDLFVAAGVFIYVGALEAIFAAVRQQATDGAYFAFSIERFEGTDFILQKTGRYAHAIPYIQRLADESGFQVALTKPVNIRKEKNGWIEGDLFVLQAR